MIYIAIARSGRPVLGFGSMVDIFQDTANIIENCSKSGHQCVCFDFIKSIEQSLSSGTRFSVAPSLKAASLLVVHNASVGRFKCIMELLCFKLTEWRKTNRSIEMLASCGNELRMFVKHCASNWFQNSLTSRLHTELTVCVASISFENSKNGADLPSWFDELQIVSSPLSWNIYMHYILRTSFPVICRPNFTAQHVA